MNRTVTAPRKAEEKDLSEKLFKKLHGLSLVYPMNEEMKKLLSCDMFLKPNQPAFFQVMHYLFCVLDSAEFKRRFFWPITDKKSESDFRTSTVDYLKHLNIKHSLNWPNIKSYLVVMPGGMKFISFLLDFVAFVIQHVTKQREKALSTVADISKYRNWTAQQFSAASTTYKEYVSEYVDQLEQNTAILRANTKKINQKIAEIASETGVDENLLSSSRFLLEFQAHNRHKCEQQIEAPAVRIEVLETPLSVLKDNVDLYQNRQVLLKRSKEASDNALRSIRSLFGTDSDADYETGNNALLSTFNGISGTIAEQLDTNDQYNESNDFVTEGLEALRAELQQIDEQVSEVQRTLNARAAESRENTSANASQLGSTKLTAPSTPMRPVLSNACADKAENPLYLKFVSTPPIRPDITNGVRNMPIRLALQDDYNATQLDSTCNNLLPLAALRSARKERVEQAAELNSTINRSKIMDPMQLLRTIKKKSSSSNPVCNLSSLGSKWKASFDDERPCVMQMPKNVSMTAAETGNSSLLAKKPAAMVKLLDASKNDLSTSPSGRLDALVVGPIPESSCLPRILLNDETIIPQRFDLDFTHFDDIDLGNISDGVLQDISM